MKTLRTVFAFSEDFRVVAILFLQSDFAWEQISSCRGKSWYRELYFAMFVRRRSKLPAAESGVWRDAARRKYRNVLCRMLQRRCSNAVKTIRRILLLRSSCMRADISTGIFHSVFPAILAINRQPDVNRP